MRIVPARQLHLGRSVTLRQQPLRPLTTNGHLQQTSSLHHLYFLGFRLLPSYRDAWWRGVARGPEAAADALRELLAAEPPPREL
jgi:hypothetical protein